MKLIHIDFVRKGITEAEIKGNLTDPERRAVGMIIIQISRYCACFGDHRINLALVGDQPVSK